MSEFASSAKAAAGPGPGPGAGGAAPAGPAPAAGAGVIWYDITTLRYWRRAAVGVVRMEHQIARFLLDCGEAQIRFCWFNKAQGRFYALDRAEVEAEMRRIDSYVTAAASTGPAAPKALEHRLMAQVERLAGRLPARQRPLLRRLVIAAKPLARQGFSLLRAVKYALQRRIASWRGRLAGPGHAALSVSAAGRGVEFAAGDIYVSLGLDWEYKDWKAIYALKRRLGFGAILCCYDIIPIKYPHLCVADASRVFAHYFVDLAWVADHIFCISECSQRDLKAFLDGIGAPVPSSSVIRLGSDLPALPEDLEHSADGAIDRLLGEDFILFVSTIERRKNHETLYRAYTRLIDEGIAGLPKLVFVGMRGWGVNDLMADLALDPRVQDKIVLLDRVDDADLARLYRKARFSCYPSLYEGWGLPVAESLSFGKFCLSSHAASLPEVGGDFVQYLDPWDVPGWAAALRRLIAAPEEVARLEARIRAEYRAPQWRDSALMLLARARQLQLTKPGAKTQPA